MKFKLKRRRTSDEPTRAIVTVHGYAPERRTDSDPHDALHYRHATDHDLPQGTVNRADELVHFAARVEQFALDGLLDEGTGFVLDGEIDARLSQWNLAVDAVHTMRVRVIEDQIADEGAHYARGREQLAEARTRHLAARREDQYYRDLLMGDAAAAATRTSDTPPVRPVGADIAVAALPDRPTKTTSTDTVPNPHERDNPQEAPR